MEAMNRFTFTADSRADYEHFLFLLAHVKGVRATVTRVEDDLDQQRPLLRSVRCAIETDMDLKQLQFIGRKCRVGGWTLVPKS